MTYRPTNLDDLEDDLNQELERRSNITAKVEELYDAINPFHDHYPPFLNELLMVLEESLDKLDDWSYEIVRELRGIGRW